MLIFHPSLIYRGFGLSCYSMASLVRSLPKQTSFENNRMIRPVGNINQLHSSLWRATFITQQAQHFNVIGTIVKVSTPLTLTGYFPSMNGFPYIYHCPDNTQTYWEQLRRDLNSLMAGFYLNKYMSIIFKFAGNLVLTIHLIYIILQ